MEEKEVKKSEEVSLDFGDTKNVAKYKEHLKNIISVAKLEAEYEELMAKKMMMMVNQYRAAEALNAYQGSLNGEGKEGEKTVEKEKAVKKEKVVKEKEDGK